MQSNIAQLSSKDHKNTKLIANKNFKHLEGHHMAPLIAHELPSIAIDLPIVFVKNNQNNEYLCVALLGLKEGENLLVKDGEWQGMMVPAGFTHYPLSLQPHPEDNTKYTITIVTDSESVSETEGEALYSEDGEETEYLKKRRLSLENYYQCAVVTREFIKMLDELELLVEQGFSFEVNGEKRNVTGIHIVDEKKFSQLPDEKVLELHKRGFLASIHAHLISLKQTQRLVKRLSTEQA
ncbi:SapC family protein [Aliikangiella sp. IMCC44359]|uniref:SapC family protein n=1 Tax=Aliikangiella sp. IMCC44359 TaxID=3459125 RepID=UPI00403B09C6